MDSDVPREDPYQEINSSQFLENLRAGDDPAKRAFAQMFACLHRPLYRFAGAYFRDHETAQDILQETYIAVHRGIKRFEGRCRLSTWIFSLAYHKICDRLADKYRGGIFLWDSADEIKGLESAETPADEALERMRLVEWVESAARKIPRIYGEVYHLRDHEGLSGEEAAAMLEISPALVRVRLHRARALIVEQLRRKSPETCREYGVGLKAQIS